MPIQFTPKPAAKPPLTPELKRAAETVVERHDAFMKSALSRPEVRKAVSEHPARPGRPPSGKVRLTLLVDPDIIEAFRATGPGWQARINEALRRQKP